MAYILSCLERLQHGDSLAGWCNSIRCSYSTQTPDEILPPVGLGGGFGSLGESQFESSSGCTTNRYSRKLWSAEPMGK